ncbi:hypothetical protein NC651_009855 [Populus alba x Populus x berolinensis]|nr:hypothetical protein NC651_009855 [Populus alba x Populus x berolinensis]
MKFTCLSKGSGFHFPPCHILDVSGFRILLDCPLDLSALTIFYPVSPSPKMEEGEQTNDFAVNNCLDMRKRQKILKSLIRAQPWYKTPNNLHLWDPSSIDLVLISSTMGMLALPFLTQTKGFSAKIYATEATTRLGQLMMEDLVLMHNEFHLFFGSDSGSPQWMSWEELELLSPALRQVALGKDGTEFGGWMPLYRSADVEDCVKKVQTLKYAEEAWYNGTLLIKAFSSGLEIGSCNWTINSPKRNIACISSSKFYSVNAMEFDYHALRGNDLILYSDFSSEGVLTNDEHDNNLSASTTYNPSTPSADNDDRILKECLLRNDESLEEREKLAFICSCVVDSVKAGGSVIIPLNQLGIVLQLLEQIPVYLESSAMKVPIYVISSVAAELLAFTNIIPEWLCKERQKKLFSGEPLFSHSELMKGEKVYVFPDVHSPELLTNWQEPCIVFSPHWSLRLGPVVHLLRRWREDENSLLVLEDGLDTDMALMPFKPMAMKVLQCSFLSGTRLQKTQPLLEMLRPKVVLFPEGLREQIKFSGSHSFSVFYYAENETLGVPRSKGSVDLEIASNLATQFSWRKLDHDDVDITRLEGQLFIDHGKHQVLSGNQASSSSRKKPLLHWGFPDVEKLLAVLSRMGVKGSVERCMSDAESGSDEIVHIHEPSKALIEKCPFEAIQIINLPKDLDKDTTHRYGPNTFKLHRLPVPRPGQVLGLVGTNGIGKSTALKVLAGKLKPNLGRFNNPPDWQEILTYFRGSELQNYFTRILEDNLKAIIKPQYVDHIPRAVQGNVGQVLDQKDERDKKAELCRDLELNQVIDRNVGDYLVESSKDLPLLLLQYRMQRYICLMNLQVILMSNRGSKLPNYVIVVEHDLSVLDYLSDFICCLYGKPGAYGVVTLPFSVREGINIFLSGFVPTENLRFRDESLTFKVAETPQENAEEIQTYARYKYPTMSKTQEILNFVSLRIVVMLGENGTGKTTFIRMLAGLLKPDTVEGSEAEIPEFNVSYKPQKISPKFQFSVRQLLHSKIRDSYMHPQFVSDVMKPLLIEQLMDQEVVNLSGGELQRVALCLCLGKPADIYLIDEPSAYLDSEQRIVASKVIKRFILHAKKTAFVVEHDFIMASYLADRVIVYEGQPSVDCTANSPSHC